MLVPQGESPYIYCSANINPRIIRTNPINLANLTPSSLICVAPPWTVFTTFTPTPCNTRKSCNQPTPAGSACLPAKSAPPPSSCPRSASRTNSPLQARNLPSPPIPQTCLTTRPKTPPFSRPFPRTSQTGTSSQTLSTSHRHTPIWAFPAQTAIRAI